MKKSKIAVAIDSSMFSYIEESECVTEADLSSAEACLDYMTDVIKRRLALSEWAAEATAIWCATTFVFDVFQIFPRLSIYSPVKRCGKTTLLELVQSFSCKPYLCSGITLGSLIRMQAQDLATSLMLDEADTFLTSAKDGIVGVLNGGYSRSGKVMRCEGDYNSAANFTTYFPVAVASIRRPPDTIFDRAIPVLLHRKPKEEIKDVQMDDPMSLFEPVREFWTTWALENKSKLAEAQKIKPKSLGNDRAVMNWISLLTLANFVGERWFSYALKAYEALTLVEVEEDPKILLISDIYDVFESSKQDRFKSRDLIDALCAQDESIWKTENKGRKIDTRFIRSLLGDIVPKTKTIYFNKDDRDKGYYRADFEAAFKKYLNKE